jgi:hypothetical protein
MKALIPYILFASCLQFTACSKKPSGVVTAKILYTHPDQVDRYGLSLRVKTGTAGGQTPAGGQPISLNGDRVMFISQKMDASNVSKIRVTIESKMDGYSSESKTLDFTSSFPARSEAAFKNGLHASVTVTQSDK